MEWILGNPQIHSAFGSLGFHRDGVYHVTDDCLCTLDCIYDKLLKDDINSCMFRTAIGLGQNIKNDLIPLLHFAKDKNIVEKTIKILANLTIPIECLLTFDAFQQNRSGHHTFFELKNLLMSAKQCFVHSNTAKVVLDFIKEMIDRTNEKTFANDCEVINNCLLLLRNILHIPEDYDKKETIITTQNIVLWNLFISGVDKILINVITSPQSECWSTAIVQLISLLYKDQPHDSLQTLLNKSLDCLSESSEDNESNTSPPNIDSEDHVTSELNSDSSDGNSAQINKPAIEAQTSDQQHRKSENLDNRSGTICSSESECQNADITNLNVIKNNDTHKFSLSSSTSDSQFLSNCSNVNNEVPSTKLEEQDTECAVLSGVLEKDLNVSHQIKPGWRDHNVLKRPSPSDDRISVSSEFSAKSDSAKRKKTKMENSVLSDPGYATQMDVQGSVSASSNEDESQQTKQSHQKASATKQRLPNKTIIAISKQEKREVQRQKVIKRSKSNTISMKGIINHTPTKEDIAYVLKEFTVDFLLKGYNRLVKILHQDLTTNHSIQIDTSHFFWLITYFLKLASHLQMDLEKINFVLSYDVLSYLTSEGVTLCEQLEIFIQNGCDLQPYIRRMHLVVTAIKEFVKAIETYKTFGHLSKKEQELLNEIQFSICQTRELRSLFALLLRLYHPEIHSRQYLQDLIVTNHLLLSFLDEEKINMKAHIQQFANVIIVGNYGLLLEGFRSNGELVNDSIFTMLHHIAGELDCMSMLIQPSILKVFSIMRKTNFELCDEWIDLIDWTLTVSVTNPSSVTSYYYVVQPSKSVPFENPSPMKTENSEADCEKWNQEDAQLLNWYYTRSLQCEDIIKNIVNLYSEHGSTKTNKSVIKQLHFQDIIDTDEYSDLLHKEDFLCNDINIIKDECNETECDISSLCEKLKLSNVSYTWVQTALLEACYTKLSMMEYSSTTGCHTSMKPSKQNKLEPVPFYHLVKKQPVPIVTWNGDQELACNHSVFLQLMKRLGLYLPCDTGKYFIRIPIHWTPEVIFETALKIGPLNTKEHSLGGILELKEIERLSFNKMENKGTLTENDENISHAQTQSTLAIKNNSLSNPSTSEEQIKDSQDNFLKVPERAKTRKIMRDSNNQGCFETTSMDLTHMLVSDEEENHQA